jgi:hypothetical protein
MTASEMSSLVQAQIGDEWGRSNPHGVNLRRCLVAPKLMTFRTARDDESRPAWLVLLEHPDKINGYAVVYDEGDKMFGLAQFAEGYEPCLFGLYGDFFTTLEAM